MKSNNALVGMALLFLVFTVSSSVVIWSDVPMPAKITMFVGGFGVGVAVGSLLARRRP